MYPDSWYKLAHAQSVCTRPFSPRREGPGDEAKGIPVGRVADREKCAWASMISCAQAQFE